MKSNMCGEQLFQIKVGELLLMNMESKEWPRLFGGWSGKSDEDQLKSLARRTFRRLAV